MAQKQQGIYVTLSDMDGTLLDSEPLYEAVHKDLATQYNITLSAHELAAQRGSGAGFYSLFSSKSVQFTKDYPCEIAFAKSRLASYYNIMAAKPDLIEEIPHVMNKFEALVDNGEAALIVTNSSFKTVEKSMAAVNRYDVYWKHAVTADQVIKQGGLVKPSGDPYDHGLERINTLHNAQYAPESCVVLEDSKVGVRSGLDFGGHIIHVITDAMQLLSEDDVRQMRKASSYCQQHFNGAAEPKNVMCYVACKPEDFDAVYDNFVQDSRSGIAMPHYQNLA